MAACIARLWLMELPSSFWLDEMATVFVARYGPAHWSLLQVAPQAWTSVYYYLPRDAARWLGESEIVYRLPSVLAMGLALWLIARLAARAIHPRAAWFAAFACLALKGINYEAADARPYALGMAVAAAALLFLVRWFDTGRWVDGFLFAAAAGLLWRVHLLFWPMYLVFGAYAAVRAKPGNRLRTAALFLLAALALIPVLRDALALAREAGTHAFAAPPSFRDLAASLKLPLVAGCGAAAWLLARCFGWKPAARISAPALALALGWWLCQPFALFALSRFTPASVFVPRYLSIGLPGAALAATLAASIWIPEDRWRTAAGVLGIGVLLWLGQWSHLWPAHHNSDWRAAARAVNRLGLGADTPVLCPSPFLEAEPPVWRPDYPLPGFLYCHLDVYRIHGTPVLLPFRGGSLDAVPRGGRFLLYGWEPQVHAWRDRLPGWRQRRLGPFADVDVVLCERP